MILMWDKLPVSSKNLRAISHSPLSTAPAITLPKTRPPVYTSLFSIGSLETSSPSTHSMTRTRLIQLRNRRTSFKSEIIH